MSTLLLIDANSIIHRAFHAMPPFTASDGRPTGALYGLASIFLKLFREEKPDYAAAAFDRPEPTFREEKYKEYKAQRPPAPNELISQIIEAHNLFQKFGIKTYEVPKFEADDIIATLSEKFGAPLSGTGLVGGGGDDLRVVILTGDRDALQLVRGDKIVVRAFKKGVSDTKTYDENAVFEEYGLKPSQIIDYKALVGDPSDNIKGVEGIGPKTAAKLLGEYGSLDGLLKHAEGPASPKTRLVSKSERAASRGGDEKLRKVVVAREAALLAKDLVSLDRNAPIGDVGLKDLSISENTEELKKYFTELGFETLIKRMEQGASTGSVPKSRGEMRPGAKKQVLF